MRPWASHPSHWMPACPFIKQHVAKGMRSTITTRLVSIQIRTVWTSPETRRQRETCSVLSSIHRALPQLLVGKHSDHPYLGVVQYNDFSVRGLKFLFPLIQSYSDHVSFLRRRASLVRQADMFPWELCHWRGLSHLLWPLILG